MKDIILLITILIQNNFYEDLLQQGIIIPIIGAIVGTIVSIIIKLIYNKIKKNRTEQVISDRGRKGKKWK